MPLPRTFILALAVMLPSTAVAQDPKPQPVQELFLTDVVYPQEKGEIQFTLGALVDRSPQHFAALIPFSIEYGLTDRWQIEAGWDGYTRFRHSPFTHLQSARLSVGTKYSFMDIAHSHVHAAVGISAEFPHTSTFIEGEGEDAVELEPALAMAIDIAPHVTLFGSARLSFQASQAKQIAKEVLEGARPDDPGTISFGSVVAFRRISLAFEYATRSDSLPWRLDGSPFVTPALILHPGHDWELGFGMPIGVRAPTRTPGLALHIIKEFG